MDDVEATRRAPFGANPTVGSRGLKTQRRIMTAALATFREVGYPAATVERITEKAGCSRPTFYQYFASKEDLWQQLASSLGTEMVASVKGLPVVGRDGAGTAAIADWIRAFTELHDDREPMFAAFTSVQRLDPSLTSGASSIALRMGRALTRATIGADGADGDVLGALVMSTVIRAIRLRRAIAADLEPERFVTGLAAAAHRAMFGPIDGVNVHRRAVPAAATPVPPIAAPPAIDRTLREQGRLLRERLLAGAVDVFVQRGYHDTRVDDIVEAAGVSHGSFYRYFANKEELFRQLAASAANAMLDLLDQLDDADSSARQEWAERWFETYAGNGAIFGIWAEQSPGTDEFGGLGTDVAMAVRNRLSQLLAPRSGGDPEVDAITMLALLEQAPTLTRTHGVPERRAVTAMVTVIANAFTGRPPAP